MAGETTDKGKMTLSSKTALRVIAHALKFPDVPVLGLLVGTQDSGVVTNALPLYHSLVYPTLAVAVQQAILFAETSNEVILGMYIVPTVSMASDKPEIRDVDMACATLVRSLAPTTVTLLALIDVKALSGALSPTATIPWCIPYTSFVTEHEKEDNKKKKMKIVWKRDESFSLSLTETTLKTRLEKMLLKRSYALLIDFDDHLDNCTLNWMLNPQFTLAHV